MDQSGQTLTIARAHAVAYRTTQESPGKSKSVSKGNFLVKLEGTGPDGEQVVGLGEAQPRGAETGDRGRISWEFLLACAQMLEGRPLPLADPSSALTAVRELMVEFEGVASTYAPQPGRARSIRKTVRGWARQVARRAGRIDDPRPLRGTLAGLEAALLDVVARGLQLSVAELLGVQAAKVPVAAPWRTNGGIAEHMMLIKEASNSEAASNDEPLWIDLAGALTPPEAMQFVHAVADAVRARELPRQIVLEQPVRSRHRHQLPQLQRKADTLATRSNRSGVDIRIMAGTSVWSRQGLERLVTRGGCGALDIRPAVVGGLLTSIELAQDALAANPDIRIYLSQLEGGTEVSAAALRNLAVAMPRVDGVMIDDDTTEVTEPEGPGFGAGMPYETMVDQITDITSFPPEPTVDEPGMTPNVYDEVPFLQPLGPNGTKGHLLEREALALGLSTTRYSKGAFVAMDGVHDPLPFKWSRSPLSSAVSLALCTHKEATRMRLARAGVPVPKGRTFAHGDYASARNFAERIGYPVVVKPAMGVRGIGVVANIQSEDELDRAFQYLEDSKLGSQDFIVEQHVTGRDYRIVVVGDEVIAAILREPASVVGNGQHSVAELMVRKNLVRRLNPHLWGRPIKYDDAARYQLERAGMTLDSVPPVGQRVLLSSSCSLSQGGDSIDVLDELHPSIKEACVDAVKAVPGLAFCGVDFLLEDHTKPVDTQQAGICELNAHAAIGNCEYPLYGQPREVARTLMQACVEHFDLVTREERAERLALQLTVRGRVTGVGYRAWMKRRAETFGLTGWVRNINERTVEVVLVGPTAAASALAAGAVLGSKNALPTSVTTTHIEPPDLDGFEIVEHAPQELIHVG
ncbi:ATP-grasp domain-containing protein [Actinobacteria bacterium YIM 96077]|uniref:acylphosphatase n=1 Tax=Phytoactinopolyspora halophila TaxID=1981511 RepID=A0A329R2S5_9ACTN|nr:acylphosphatase [Phytoactinopolyspora halophila]AYY11925.1 ATP-grasp domain-containing protein [Actinobacteria bacterium YIM 96077]RAW18841.1 hypothetical protein DPM12_01935 [Phytoactinopolyspora halophila]